MSDLIRYDAACRAVAEAKNVDEVKDLRDKAEAMRAYARQAKNRELEIDAAEIRMRAERRLGELIRIQKETVGLHEGGRPAKTSAEPEVVSRATLNDAGIDHKLSSRAQKLAAVPEARFEGMIGEWRDRVQQENERVTTRLIKEGENEQIKAGAVVLPDGRFDVIVMDPPWPMEKIEREVRPNQTTLDYPTMSEDDLIAYGEEVAKRAAEDCHLFLWTTHKFLPLALNLIGLWGFRYVCTFAWHKPGGFQPIGLPQYNCEFVLYARMGTPSFVDTKAFFCCFDAPRREHSRKPDEFYSVVRRVTEGRRADWFARGPREGFEVIGNELGKFADVVS